MSSRKIRERNKRYYRVLHWPIWVWVFFLAPGPLTFDLFAHGGSPWHVGWLGVVCVGTAIAGFFGELPGVEPKPYILRFNENKRNPIYRRVCYTFAWNALISFGVLNFVGLLQAVETGRWQLRQIYDAGYYPISAVVLALGALGKLPRAGRTTQGEGYERRYFYGAVWSVTIAQTILLIMWKTMGRSHEADIAKTFVYVGILGIAAVASAAGMLPRTRPILPGELMVAD